MASPNCLNCGAARGCVQLSSSSDRYCLCIQTSFNRDSGVNGQSVLSSSPPAAPSSPSQISATCSTTDAPIEPERTKIGGLECPERFFHNALLATSPSPQAEFGSPTEMDNHFLPTIEPIGSLPVMEPSNESS